MFGVAKVSLLRLAPPSALKGLGGSETCHLQSGMLSVFLQTRFDKCVEREVKKRVAANKAEAQKFVNERALKIFLNSDLSGIYICICIYIVTYFASSMRRDGDTPRASGRRLQVGCIYCMCMYAI